MTPIEILTLFVAFGGALGGLLAWVIGTVRHYTQALDGMHSSLAQIRGALMGDEYGGRGIVGRLSDMETQLAEIEGRLEALEEQGRV